MLSWMASAPTWSSLSLAWCTATIGRRAVCVTIFCKVFCTGDLMLVSACSSNSSVSPSLSASKTWYGLRTHQSQARQVCWRCHARHLASIFLLLVLLHSSPHVASAVFTMKKIIWYLRTCFPIRCQLRRVHGPPPITLCMVASVNKFFLSKKGKAWPLHVNSS